MGLSAPSEGVGSSAPMQVGGSAPLIETDGLSIGYRSRAGVMMAVQRASVVVRPGESVALVGESGSGKSTFARAMLGLLPEKTGRIEAGRILIEGRDVTRYTTAQWETLRGHPIAMVFQDPLSFLNPVMRIGKQIAESVRRHDPSVRRVEPRVGELLERVRLPAACARAFPHELSGGMRQRVLLAIALGCRPRLLIADEPTTALDVTTQAEILSLLRDLRHELGDMAMLLISHDLGVVWHECERIYVMFRSCVVEEGVTREVLARPAHPYTAALVEAAQAARNAQGQFTTIEGEFSTAQD
ncbi:ABC transporter ATP-binding protein [Paraburkholderia humisilvae]|uniref:Oligopeptide transport ATP-binding protein OppD n=1 Tax=Paraburkholderia humisilvae TaxID=627669 RepID=A0A6J5F5E8_9BURK|nr:ABC transporter ATP-binding protein [Paraburkholderia humisilvae]CAB3773714.1 Oligopeptide transport ATP-binding protein OppD [Paraburkholderia humisilvae]